MRVLAALLLLFVVGCADSPTAEVDAPVAMATTNAPYRLEVKAGTKWFLSAEYETSDAALAAAGAHAGANTSAAKVTQWRVRQGTRVLWKLERVRAR